MITASNDATACLWDAVTGSPIHVLSGHGSSVWSAVFSPDGDRVATGSGDGTARLWSRTSGQQLQSFTATGAPIDLVAFSPDGRVLAAAVSDGFVALWDSVDGRVVRRIDGTSSLWSIRFDRSGRLLATAGEDGRAELHRLDGPSTTLAGHDETVWSTVFSVAGDRVATVGADGTVRVWSTDRGAQIAELASGRGSLSGAAFVDRDRMIVSAARSGALEVWEIESGALVASHDRAPMSFESLCVLDDGGVAVSTSNGAVIVWDLLGTARSF